MIQLNKMLAFLLSCIIIFSACQESETIAIYPEFAIPLINSSLSIQDILDQANTGDIVNVGNDNFITLKYENDLFGTDTVDLIVIPSFSIPQVLPTQSVPLPFPADTDIRRIEIKSGKMYVNFDIPATANGNVTTNITLSNFKSNGNTVSFTTITDGSTSHQDSFDLAGYDIDFTSGNFTSSYTAIDGNNLPVTLSNFLMNFPNLDYDYIEGYFGMEGFVIPLQELSLDLFEQWKDGKVTFTEPKIRLRFDNSYGFPLQVNFDTLQTITRDQGNFDIVSFGLIDRNLNYPQLNERGVEKRTNINLNKDNSNLVEAFEAAPFGLRYQFSGIANVNANPSIIGFATDESKLAISVIAELPLEGAVENFTIVDTFDLDLTADEIPEGEIEFKILANNGFPLDIDLQCYFLDGFNQTIDSMFVANGTSLIQAAPVDSDGKVTIPLETITFRGFTLDQVRRIRQDSKKIVLQGRFNTTNNGMTNIKLYSDYELGLKIGAKIKPVIE
jgi:hypothetical protein